jgi:pimeloyl-ACP methyl ester carboxylesterase
MVGVLSTIGGVLFALGHSFLEEFTRPGITIEPDMPQWGGWTFPETTAEPPKEVQHNITFQSADSTLLRGTFWAQPRRAPTIIISHGFRVPSSYFYSVAALGYAHGANMLLFDYRGHGESSFVPTTCGNAEVNDLVAAINVASSQPETTQVYILGFSMGAAAAIMLPPHPAVVGIIADSPYARLDVVLNTLLTQTLDQQLSGWPCPAQIMRPLAPSLAHLILLVGQLLFRMRFRYSLVARPDQAISNYAARYTGDTSEAIPPPILLIHSEGDPLISLHHAHQLVAAARTAGRSIQEHYTPSDIHCGSFQYDPNHYVALLQEFGALQTHSTKSIENAR